MSFQYGNDLLKKLDYQAGIYNKIKIKVVFKMN